VSRIDASESLDNGAVTETDAPKYRNALLKIIQNGKDNPKPH
jgi:hypothetical protein